MDSSRLTPLPGISGTLFPSRYLASISLESGPAGDRREEFVERRRRDFLAWWIGAERQCGPATGLRALFDRVAMPLASLLDFRAHDAEFEDRLVTARLESARGAVRLVLAPWATRPSRVWRGLKQADAATWCLLVAPPFVSMVDLRGHSMRRSVDFRLPDALDPRSFPAFVTACSAGASLDALVKDGARFQDAVRADLQAGVVQALAAIRPVLSSRAYKSADDFSEALTIVYRVLFLLFAESRALVPQQHPRYGPGYSVTSLCRDALSGNPDAPSAWDGLAAVTRLSRLGCDSEHLIVRPFNGRLFARSAAPALESGRRTRRATGRARHRDEALRRAMVALGTRPGPGGREEIAYADLGVEQLGAVYERVLDLDPDALDAVARERTGSAPSTRQHSARRKDTGTFYTPQPLAELVVRRALAPLVAGACADDILALRVIDPAMGSGAFLVAACRYLSHAYERALVNEGRCAETDLDPDMRANIRRTVAARCLAGVDANPVAVQLARLSLWLTTLARDKPLSFLDHRLRAGDSLIGAVPEDLWRVPMPGRGRRDELSEDLFGPLEFDAAVRDVVTPLRQLHEGADNSVTDVRARERLWTGIADDQSPLARWRAACDLWCARWFWRTGRPPAAAEIRAVVDALVRGDRTLGSAHIGAWLDQARSVARERRFFHWPLEFADVFYDATGARLPHAGFDVVIGNPPWDVVRRDRGSLMSFVRESGHYRASTRGHLNLYQPFVELALRLAKPGGRIGMVLPWGAATDDGAAALREKFFTRTNVDALAGLDNAQGIFPIHRGLRFLVLSATNGARTQDIRARFGVHSAEDIDALPSVEHLEDERTGVMRLAVDTIRRASGPALRIPDVRRPDLFARLLDIRRRIPALGSAEGWAAIFGRELNASDDRKYFSDIGLPVLDGKHISPFRTAVESTDRRIDAAVALGALPDMRFTRARLAYRDVSGVGNRRALIAAVIPGNVVTTHTLFCLRNPLPLDQQHFLCGVLNSDLIDAITRMLMGGHVTTSLMESLPVPPWTGSDRQQRIAAIALTLASHDEPEGDHWKQLQAESNALVDSEFSV
ncbi:MAG TPA: N-6 DNA methylase [Vicinamibacterales bacterium]|nr:N-6 DNA methylase [Vicinamibacterales bacterium]